MASRSPRLNHVAVEREAGGFLDVDVEELAEMRRGRAPTITQGQPAGTEASVDHTLPRSIVPELDSRLYNLRTMPKRLNQSKGNRITEKEAQLARRWNRDGLLSDEGLRAVEEAAQRR